MNDREIDRTTFVAVPLTVLATIAALGLTAFAAMADTLSAPPARSTTGPTGSIVAGTATMQDRDLVGMKVVDVDGAEVGQVTRVDRLPGGQIDVVEISSGGFLGFGARALTVSPSTLEPGEEQIVLRMPRHEIERKLR